MTIGNQPLLVFTLHDHRYALPMPSVAEVMETPALFPIPRAPQIFHGAINFHGNFVAALNLAALLGPGSSPEGGKLLVLDPAIAAIALAIGPTVDFVSAVSLDEESGDSPLVTKVIHLADGKVRLLDIAAILAATEETLHG